MPESVLPSPPLVRCAAVTKVFGRREVLGGLDISVKRFERLAVLGTSGSGKTTLLRIVAGLDPVTSGQVLLNGRRLDSYSAAERRIGMVFQKPAVYPHLSVRENLAFPLEVHGIEKRMVALRVAELADLLGLRDLLGQRAGSLSGGEAQRVAIGKAIADPPELLLLDEPFSNLHQSLRWKMIDDLRDLQLAAKLTILFVTHDPVEAFYLADRVAVLSQGRIVQDATPAAMVSAPQTLDVARLIYDPAPNVLEGEMRGRKGDPVTRIFEAPGVVLELEPAADVDIPERVMLVWRPQDARLEHELSPAERAKFSSSILEGSVKHTAYYDGRLLVVVANSSGTVVKAAALDAAHLPKSGSVQVCVDPLRVLCFDATRQVRIALCPRKTFHGDH